MRVRGLCVFLALEGGSFKLGIQHPFDRHLHLFKARVWTYYGPERIVGEAVGVGGQRPDCIICEEEARQEFEQALRMIAGRDPDITIFHLGRSSDIKAFFASLR